MKTKNFTTNAILFVVLLVAYNLGSYAQPSRFKTIRQTLTINLPKAKYDDIGHEVSVKVARRCMDLFKDKMQLHAIIDSIAKVNLVIDSSRKITTAEVFGGEDLLKWMEKTINKFDKSRGRNVGIKLAFGIYTDELLDSLKIYSNARQEIFKRRNRITVFLIPCDKNKRGAPIFGLEESPYRRVRKEKESFKKANNK
ncbi:MAG: hypothetical protein WKG06_07850 [Segetibacter sp.]